MELCCCFLQEAVEENEQRKKQEEAMREKLLAQEAKQHDPKVKSKCLRKKQINLIALNIKLEDCSESVF